VTLPYPCLLRPSPHREPARVLLRGIAKEYGYAPFDRQ
jgi:hypothetical protein